MPRSVGISYLGKERRGLALPSRLGMLARSFRRFWLGASPTSYHVPTKPSSGCLWPSCQPLLSVVIPCFNTGHTLIDTLRSLRHQTFQDFEVLIVDDGSDDRRTIRLLRRLERFSEIQMIRQENEGPGAARNTGIKRSVGKYICCLDSDDCLAPDYLEKCLIMLEADSGLGVAYSWMKLFGEEQRLCRSERLDTELLLFFNHVGVSAVFRRESWVMVGGYSEHRACLYEDWDFWIRLASLGIRGKVVPEPLFFYRRHGRTRLHRANQYAWEMHSQLRRSHVRFFNDRLWRRELLSCHVFKWVDNPMLNLSRTTQYRPFIDALNLIHLRSEGVGGLYEAVQLLPLSTILYVVVEHEFELPSWLTERAAVIYRLPFLLDCSQWAEFVDNFIATRNVSRVLVANE